MTERTASAYVGRLSASPNYILLSCMDTGQNAIPVHIKSSESPGRTQTTNCALLSWYSPTPRGTEGMNNSNPRVVNTLRNTFYQSSFSYASQTAIPTQFLYPQHIRHFPCDARRHSDYLYFFGGQIRWMFDTIQMPLAFGSP